MTAFSSWAASHKMTKRESWFVQQALGAVCGWESPEYLEARAYWEKATDPCGCIPEAKLYCEECMNEMYKDMGSDMLPPHE